MQKVYFLTIGKPKPSYAWLRDKREEIREKEIRELFLFTVVFGLNFVLINNILKNPLACYRRLSPLRKGMYYPPSVTAHEVSGNNYHRRHQSSSHSEVSHSEAYH